METIQLIVLAGGKGRRMMTEKPKVLVPLCGRPMILHLLDTALASRIFNEVSVVVGQGMNDVMKVLGPGYSYIEQKEQLGTGHAVLSARAYLKDRVENIMVLYGDHPFVSEKTMKSIWDKHRMSGATLTMATSVVSDFDQWRRAFYEYGRIVRDTNGNILKIVEKNDATEEEKQIKEINPSYFCFKASWLWDRLTLLTNVNVQKEYYLTDLVGFAVREKASIATVSIRQEEALGANTSEQLKNLSRIHT